jgi:hypothetical protein
VPLIDPRTGLIDRAWYLFFLSLNNIATGVVDDVNLGADAVSLIASYDAALQALAQNVDTQPPPVDLSAELTKQIQEAGLTDQSSALLSQIAEMQKQIEALNLLPAPPESNLTSGTSILYGNGSGGFSNVTIGSGVSFAGGTLSATGSGGSVTSVGLSLPSQFTVTNSPVTGAGTLTGSWNNQTANYVLAGPTTGAAAAPTFRALVSGDIPSLSYVTSVTGTAPVVSSGGLTPAISMAAANTSTNGYLTSTDWNTFNNKGSGTVTSVTGTAPVVSSGGTTPAISMAAANTSTNGYLTSTDWNTFNNKGSGTVTAVSVVSANGFAGTSSGGATPALTLSTTITGLLKGNGTAISAATANTDYMGVAAPVTKTADFTVSNGDIWYINNKSGSTCTVTLPAASSWTGRSLTFKNMQAQTLVSASSNVVPIDSTSAGTAILLAVVGNWATMVSDGTNWVIMQAASNNNLLLE